MTTRWGSSVRSSGRRIALAVSVSATVVSWLAAAPVVAAHGEQVPPPPDPAGLLLGWSFDPTIWLPVLLAAAVWFWTVRRVNVSHPAHPVPVGRTWAFMVGLAAILVALQSGIERYDTFLFSVHMVQHLLLVFVAAPLLVLAAPVTLALRAATPNGRRRILAVLRSRPFTLIAHPLVAWLAFAVAMWGSHVTPLFDAALEDPLVHDLEHVLYLGTALLFWMPVAGVDPAPWRLPFPARILFVLLQLPLNSFLGVVILFADHPIYPHYVTTGRPWGPLPLEDQEAAGALMWGIGDLAFLVAIMLVIAAWMRDEEATTRRREAVADARASAQSQDRAPAQPHALPAAPAGHEAEIAGGAPPGSVNSTQAPPAGIGAAR